MEIKLPVKWLKEKGILLDARDKRITETINSTYLIFDCESITSFADRENTGKQPVEDWVPVTLSFLDPNYATTAHSIFWGAHKKGETWKPNAEALMKIYLAEQEQDGFMKTFEQETKKETKLKLTKDDIGKKFECTCELLPIVKMVYANDTSGKFVFEHSNGAIWVSYANGDAINGKGRIIKRHEPRYWLKDLPNADLFDDRIQSIFCTGSGWFVRDGGHLNGCIITNRMPKLEISDYEESLISIKDLREWQLTNKVQP